MPSKLLMTGAATALFLSGLSCLFAPAEILAGLGDASPGAAGVLVQLLGAAFLGLGSLDWWSRVARVGGIYSRPIVAGNFAQFGCGSLVLVRAVIAAADAKTSAALAIYLLFAVAFGFKLFGSGGSR